MLKLGMLLTQVLMVTLATVAANVAQAEPPRAWGPSEQERFLASAEVVELHDLDVGITGSQRAVLRDEGVQHSAHIQTVDVFKDRYTNGQASYVNFRDHHRYNVAAYRVAALVSLEDMVPVSVARKLGKQSAAFTWWVDDVQMMEADRIREGVYPPNPVDFQHQMRQAKIFAQLIADVDMNAGNLLITDDWKVWMVDFTRSFRPETSVLDKSQLGGRIDRDFLEGMKRLELEPLLEELKPVLSKLEIKGLMRRRDEIVAFYEHQIEQLGEDLVVCDLEH